MAQERGHQSTGEEFSYFSRTQPVQASLANVNNSAFESRNGLEGSKTLPDSAIVRLRTTLLDLAADAGSHSDWNNRRREYTRCVSEVKHKADPVMERERPG